MPRARPWTDTDTRQLRKLHHKGHTLHECAEIMGRAKSTLSRKSPALGLSWDRKQTETATRAHMADAKMRRAQLARDLLEEARDLLRDMRQPATAWAFGGRDNVYREHQVNEPSFRDKRDIMGALNVAIVTSLRLEDYDSGDTGSIGSLLGSLFDNLQAKHGTGDDA